MFCGNQCHKCCLEPEYSHQNLLSQCDFKVAQQWWWDEVAVDNKKVSGVRYFVWFLLEQGRSDRLKFYWQLQNYIAKSNRVAGTEEIFSRAPCIMDGLKRLARNCSPATDAVCRCSLEISGHCLVAVGVIASLLVGPAKKREERRKISFYPPNLFPPLQLRHTQISTPHIPSATLVIVVDELWSISKIYIFHDSPQRRDER